MKQRKIPQSKAGVFIRWILPEPNLIRSLRMCLKQASARYLSPLTCDSTTVQDTTKQKPHAKWGLCLVAPPRLELGTQGSSGLCSTN